MEKLDGTKIGYDSGKLPAFTCLAGKFTRSAGKFTRRMGKLPDISARERSGKISRG